MKYTQIKINITPQTANASPSQPADRGGKPLGLLQAMATSVARLQLAMGRFNRPMLFSWCSAAARLWGLQLTWSSSSQDLS
jgi:hypothetical protein